MYLIASSLLIFGSFHTILFKSLANLAELLLIASCTSPDGATFMDFFCTSLVFFILLVQLAHANYTSFSDSYTKEVGIRNQDGVTCLSLLFEQINIINLNINGTDNIVQFDISDAAIGGRCASTFKGDAYLFASITNGRRKKKLKFYFIAKNVYVKQYEELRWQLQKVVYSETFENKTVSFESHNASVALSAPLNQKFVCKDKINVTLSNEQFKDVVVVFHPEIDLQPFGLKSNLYVCERTRKRTLSESFEKKTTVFSGVILALTSMGIIIGHTVKRQRMPERKQQYLNLDPTA